MRTSAQPALVATVLMTPLFIFLSVLEQWQQDTKFLELWRYHQVPLPPTLSWHSLSLGELSVEPAAVHVHKTDRQTSAATNSEKKHLNNPLNSNLKKQKLSTKQPLRQHSNNP